MITTAVSLLLKSLESELNESQKLLFKYAEVLEKKNCELAYKAGKTDELLKRETKLFKEDE